MSQTPMLIVTEALCNWSWSCTKAICLHPVPVSGWQEGSSWEFSSHMDVLCRQLVVNYTCDWCLCTMLTHLLYDLVSMICVWERIYIFLEPCTTICTDTVHATVSSSTTLWWLSGTLHDRLVWTIISTCSAPQTFIVLRMRVLLVWLRCLT